MKKLKPPEIFLCDVDGVLTDGKFYYSESGKIMKKFGADDNDALSLLDPYIKIQFISGDKRGFSISKKRISDDMKRPIELVSTIHRIDWIKERYDTSTVIYMGDGIFDHYVFKQVRYSIAPANADLYALKAASFVTRRGGGDRAVSEAVIHILESFFKPYNRDIPPYSKG